MKYLLIAISLIFLGCEKDSNNDTSKTSYFRMKVNGDIKEYDTCYVFESSQTAGSIYYQWNFLGGRPGDYGGVYVNDIVPIQDKQYLSTDLNDASTTPMAGLGAYRPAGTSDIYVTFQAGWPLYDASVEITSIDNEYVVGNFHGKMRLVGGDSILNVTDGEFKARR